MPRGAPRIYTPVRLSPKGRTWVEDLATELGSDLSTVIRVSLAVARLHESEVKALIKEQA